MAQNISDEDIEDLRKAIAMYKPYPLSVLDQIKFDDDTYDDNRIYATWALKMLLENGIQIEDDPAQP